MTARSVGARFNARLIAWIAIALSVVNVISYVYGEQLLAYRWLAAANNVPGGFLYALQGLILTHIDLEAVIIAAIALYWVARSQRAKADGKRWSMTVCAVAYCLAVSSVYGTVSFICSSTDIDSLDYVCDGVEVLCFLGWPILAFIGVRDWVSKSSSESSAEACTRFGDLMTMVFAIVATSTLFVCLYFLESYFHTFMFSRTIGLRLYLIDVALAVLAGLAIGFWPRKRAAD